MKKIILLFLFSINAYALTTSDLLIIKKNNYQLMKSHYLDLKKELINGNPQSFCKIASSIVTDLFTIYEQDRDLFFSLKEHGNEDFNNYAVHINNNSRTDLFNFNYYEHKCNSNDALAILGRFELTQMNLDFLIMTHNQWIKAFFPNL